MEVIDISKFYRFESVPNPLVLASEIFQFNKKRDNNLFVTIDNISSLVNPLTNSTKIPSLEFDDIISQYLISNSNNKTFLLIRNKVKKILNKIPIYIIVKAKKVDPNNFSFILLPISNFERLSNTAINRLYLHRDGLFEINANPSLYFGEKFENDPRFYSLLDLLTTQGVFDSELDTKTKNVPIETEDDILQRKGLQGKLLGDNPKFYSLSEFEKLEYLPVIDPDPEILGTDDKDSIWIQKYGIPRQDYEYNEAEMDNILFNNPRKYSLETSKNIFPIFESLADAENFLLTILEDLIEPYRKKTISIKKKDFFELSRKEQYFLLLPTSYILQVEDSQVFDTQNLDFINNPTEHYQKPFKKSKINNPISFFIRRKVFNSYEVIKPSYKMENYDQNAFLPRSNSYLINQGINIKILKIGIADFLDIWLSREDLQRDLSLYKKTFEKFTGLLKNGSQDSNKGELLFIPKLINKSNDVTTKNSIPLLNNNIYKQKIFENQNENLTSFKVIYEIGKLMSQDEAANFVN